MALQFTNPLTNFKNTLFGRATSAVGGFLSDTQKKAQAAALGSTTRTASPLPQSTIQSVGSFPTPTFGATQLTPQPTSQAAALAQPAPQPTFQASQPTPQPTPQPAPANQDILNQLASLQQTAQGLQGQVANFQPQGLTPDQVQERIRTQEAQNRLRTLQGQAADLQQITPEEEALQKQLSNVLTSRELGIAAVQDRPIPQEFFTGRIAALQRQAALQTQPLLAQLQLLQARREGAQRGVGTQLESAQGIVEQQQRGAERAQELGIEQQRFERQETLAQQKLSEEQRQFNVQSDLAKQKFAEDRRQFGLQYALSQQKAAEDAAAKVPEVSPYQQERGIRIIQSVDNLIGRVGNLTTGVGSIAAYFPATAARNFQAELDTLKSNIAFGELVAMREASKTGGALGNVSDREGQLLQSALGALDTGQSPANFKKQLQQIKDSLLRWNQALQQYSGQAGGTSGTTSSGLKYTIE